MACVTLLVLISVLPIFAQAGKGYGAEVLAVSPLTMATLPGNIVSLSLRVTNSSERDIEFREVMPLPPTWQPVVPLSTFTLAAGKSTVRFLAFQVPLSTAAGAYPLTYTARAIDDPGIYDEETVTINVIATDRLAWNVEERPEYVIAGQRYDVGIRLLNQGNATRQVAISAQGLSREYPITVDPTSVTLAPGSNVLVRLTVQTDAKERRSFSHAVEVRAATLGKSTPPVNTTVSVTVLPLADGKADLHHALESELTMYLVGDQRQSGAQFMLRGGGTLDPALKQQVDFLLLGPDHPNRSSYALRDEGHINYRDENMDIRLGDQSYGMSPLIEPSRYGRGMGFEFHGPQRLDMGGFLVNDRRGGEFAPQSRGVYLRQRVGGARVTANYFTRTGYTNPTRAKVHDEIWSVESVVQLMSRVNLHLEYAGSSTDRAGEMNDHGYRVEASGTMPGGGYLNGRYIRAGADFHGYYHDAEYTVVSLTQPISSRLTVSPSYSVWRKNLERDPARNSAPDERLAQVNVQYRLDEAWTLTASAGDYRRRDTLAPATFHTREQPFRVGVGKRAGKWSWNAEVEVSRYENLLLHSSSVSTGIRVFASYRPNVAQFFTLYGGISDQEREGQLLGKSRYIGASTVWIPSSRVTITGSLSTNASGDGLIDTGNANLSLRYSLSGGRALVLQVHHSSGENGSTDFALSYNIPFDFKLMKRRDVGAITGRFHTGESHTGGIGNVVLMLNGVGAVTDEQGRFTFSNLKPGKYYLNVDRKTLGLHRITDQPLPITVMVKGGEVTTVEIGVIDGVDLRGAILVLPRHPQSDEARVHHVSTVDSGHDQYLSGDPMKSNGGGRAPSAMGNAQMAADLRAGASGQPNLYVEITDGKDTYRRVTESDGTFLFENLHPGIWQVKVYEDNLPSLHYLEQATTEITLLPGSEGVVYFRVLPRLRRIQMLPDPVESRQQPPKPPVEVSLAPTR